jgi:hypothetical protein
MTDTPFWDKARELARKMDYVDMQVGSRRARSHAWWRRMVEYGPWGGGSSGAGRVGPPEREAIPGIAVLFDTTPERVAEMIAADWYGVETDARVSSRVLNLSHLVDGLDDEDVALVEKLVRRLSPRRRTVEVRASDEAIQS